MLPDDDWPSAHMVGSGGGGGPVTSAAGGGGDEDGAGQEQSQIPRPET